MPLLRDTILLLLILSNFRLLGTARLTAVIQTMVWQAVALGALPLALYGPHLSPRLVLLALTTVAVKGLILPWLLRRALRASEARREVEPLIGFTTSILLATLMLGLCVWVVRPLAHGMPSDGARLLAVALFTILTGLLMIVSRRKALTQVIGYLAMENGVYAFGTALAVEEPLLVELGVLLDVFVAVFVMGIAIYHINREFDHIDTDRLSLLKD